MDGQGLRHDRAKLQREKRHLRDVKGFTFGLVTWTQRGEKKNSSPCFRVRRPCVNWLKVMPEVKVQKVAPPTSATYSLCQPGHRVGCVTHTQTIIWQPFWYRWTLVKTAIIVLIVSILSCHTIITLSKHHVRHFGVLFVRYCTGQYLEHSEFISELWHEQIHRWLVRHNSLYVYLRYVRIYNMVWNIIFSVTDVQTTGIVQGFCS